MLPTSVHRFTQQYLHTARWSSTDSDGNNLDDHEWSMKATDKAVEDCLAFTKKVESAFDAETSYDILTRENPSAAHDFWLTRVGHGAGFWDGDWEDVDPKGAKLTEISKSFKRLDVEVGDDGLLYFL